MSWMMFIDISTLSADWLPTISRS